MDAWPVAGVAADDGAGGVVGCHKARVGEPYPDGSQGYAGGDRRGGTGHRGNRSGEGPGKAVDKDRGGLADVEVAAVRVGEVEVDVDVLIRHDLQKLCACADAVPLVHITPQLTVPLRSAWGYLAFTACS